MIQSLYIQLKYFLLYFKSLCLLLLSFKLTFRLLGASGAAREAVVAPRPLRAKPARLRRPLPQSHPAALPMRRFL